MKYGEHLKANIAPEYGSEPYLKYSVLDNIIRDLSQKAPSSAVMESRQVSLTTSLGSAQSNELLTEESFLGVLEDEMAKVEAFTLKKVTELRQKIAVVETMLNQRNRTKTPTMRGVRKTWSGMSTDDKKKKKKPNATAPTGSSTTSTASSGEDTNTPAATTTTTTAGLDNHDNNTTSTNLHPDCNSSLYDSNDSTSNEDISFEADEIADDFLRLEKYVNINFMGFHKILKKHDKYLPNNPCKGFYVNRMHAQAWVRGDYSDLVVRLSHIYSSIREDKVVSDADADKNNQSFLRSTTKYWVKTEDVSRVKYAILRHLPVFLQKTSTGESDSQFTNSVYLDNDQLELYHGRLDKTPGAIALRLRWYGTETTKKSVVFVERKTHHEKWTGEVSVKERFMIDEDEVQQVLTNTYPIEEKKQKMIQKGKSQKEIDEWETLVREVTQVTASKQLVPTVRTQCMRTAFQIPFDATVRISLDTNLCMISERGYDLNNMKQWHRDPSWVLKDNEITRFPHAVLEIKLQLSGGNMTPPQWVTELQNSGWLYECHKYSKYVHGCAVLLPDDVQSVPYWVDDVSLRKSIIASGASRMLASESEGTGSGANAVYTHLLPFGDTLHDRRETAIGRAATSSVAATGNLSLFGGTKNHKQNLSINNNNKNNDQTNKTSRDALTDEGMNFYSGDWENLPNFRSEEDLETKCCGSWMFSFCSPHRLSLLSTSPSSASAASRHHHTFFESVVAPTSIQKIEPKLFFANERTCLHWLHHSVVLSSIASGILAFSKDVSGETWGVYYAMALLPLSFAYAGYALYTYLWRIDRMKTRIPGRWDDPLGPLLLGTGVAIVLAINFCTKMYEIFKFKNIET